MEQVNYKVGDTIRITSKGCNYKNHPNSSRVTDYVSDQLSNIRSTDIFKILNIGKDTSGYTRLLIKFGNGYASYGTDGVTLVTSSLYKIY